MGKFAEYVARVVEEERQMFLGRGWSECSVLKVGQVEYSSEDGEGCVQVLFRLVGLDKSRIEVLHPNGGWIVTSDKCKYAGCIYKPVTIERQQWFTVPLGSARYCEQWHE